MSYHRSSKFIGSEYYVELVTTQQIGSPSAETEDQFGLVSDHILLKIFREEVVSTQEKTIWKPKDLILKNGLSRELLVFLPSFFKCDESFPHPLDMTSRTLSMSAMKCFDGDTQTFLLNMMKSNCYQLFRTTDQGQRYSYFELNKPSTSNTKPSTLIWILSTGILLFLVPSPGNWSAKYSQVYIPGGNRFSIPFQTCISFLYF